MGGVKASVAFKAFTGDKKLWLVIRAMSFIARGEFE
jgi:hypothetical protein